MAEFLELIETYRGNQVNVANIFGGEGRRIVPKNTPEYEARFAKALEFIADVQEGRRPVQQIREAMTTSDFPFLFGDALDRQMLAAYQAPLGPEYEWRDYCRIGTVPDFRTVKRFSFTGLTARLTKVGQKEEYPESARDEAKYEYAISKFGRKADIAWEAFIDDDLGAFRDIPAAFATAAKNTDFYEFSALWVANATLFSAGHSNKGTGVLNEANLGLAIQAMRSQKDPSGSPILIQPRYLVVGPSKEIAARKLLQSLVLTYAGGAGASPSAYPTANVVAQLGLVLKINPWIEIIDATNGATSWYLFADKANVAAVEMGFLRGYEDPQIFMKAANALRIGGGEVSPFDGDFDDDDIWYKLRHCNGGATLDYRGAYWSDGTV